MYTARPNPIIYNPTNTAIIDSRRPKKKNIYIKFINHKHMIKLPDRRKGRGPGTGHTDTGGNGM